MVVVRHRVGRRWIQAIPGVYMPYQWTLPRRFRSLTILCCFATTLAMPGEKHLPDYLADAGMTADAEDVAEVAPAIPAPSGSKPDGAVVPTELLPSGAGTVERLSRTVKPGEPFTPLTLRQKARLQLLTTFQPETLARVAVTAGMATVRDSPEEWPRTVEAYQWRFADRIGQRLVFKQVQFTVGSMLFGEDPRYFMAEDRGKWSRVKSAFKQTWMVRRDNGHWAPAYGTFAGAYAASVVSSRWQPERRQQWDGVMIRGTSQIGFQFCNHLLREFMPEIKKAFRK